MKTIKGDQKRSQKTVLILLVIVAFIAGIFATFLAFYTLSPGENTIIGGLIKEKFYGEETAMVNAVKSVMPSVVSVEVTPGPKQNKKNLVGGAGFVVDASGVVMTNKHITKRDSKTSDYKVTFYDGKVYQAVFVSEDPFNDVAFLRIVAEQGTIFPAVKFADFESIEIGQKVFAIGNVLLVYSHSVTAGIVSAMNRDVSADYYDFKGPSENMSGLIQTDASINLGNSGGPLVNLNGEVIGMITALEEKASGIGFAVPTDDLIFDLNSIKEHGEIIRPVLGVRFVMLDDNSGAMVVEDKTNMREAVLKNSNAYKAGLRFGDVITYVDETKIDSSHYLNDVVAEYEPGDKITLKVWSSLLDLKQERSIEVVLNSSKDFVQK